MNTATIVVVAIWNTLLLTALAVAIIWRTEVLGWITRLDRHENGSEIGDDEWNRFLAGHPELVDRQAW
jgi:hypothetical protein